MNLLLNLFFSLSVFASPCKQYSVRCECVPAVPFEGFEIYFVEKCDQKEDYYKAWSNQYDTHAVCVEAINTNKYCLAHTTRP